MGIPFEKLEIPRWEGVTPGRVERGPMVLGSGCVVDPPVVLSPMAAVTNPPFRKLCRDEGAGLVVTEMVYSEGLIHGTKKSLEGIDIRDNEHPVSVQLYGKDPEIMARAAVIVQEAGADAVDVNMGCPMRKVVSSGHGAALLKTPERVYEIFKAMSEAVDIPVTGKIRAGWEDASAVAVGQAIEAGGGAAVTIHGRTRCDFYDGHADLEVIRQLKENVGIAVIGNGDVRDWVTARRMYSITGCDAVMVARGCLGNPWVFREIAADLRGDPVPERPGLEEKRAMMVRHLDLYVETFGEGRTSKEIRKHLLWYVRGTQAERAFRARMKELSSRDDIMRVIDEVLSDDGALEAAQPAA